MVEDPGQITRTCSSRHFVEPDMVIERSQVEVESGNTRADQIDAGGWRGAGCGLQSKLRTVIYAASTLTDLEVVNWSS